MRQFSLGCLVAFACVAAISAQDRVAVPDPLSLLDSIGPYRTVGEKAQAQSDLLAADAERVLERARSSFAAFDRARESEASARRKAFEARQRGIDLAAERERVLEEMRHGLFCRACKRTRSQVQAAGEDWQTHLDRNSQGRAVGASSAELAKTASDYDAEILTAQAEVDRAQRTVSISAQEQVAASRDVQNAYVKWKQALVAEDVARAHAWEAAMETYRQRVYRYTGTISTNGSLLDVVRARDPKSPRIPILESEIALNRNLMAQLSREAEADYMSRTAQEATFAARIESGRRELEAQVSQVGGPPLSFLTGATTLPAGSVTVPNTPFSASASGSSFQVNAALGGLPDGLGKFRASLRVSNEWLRDKLHVELVLGLDTKAGTIEGGMRRTTEWGPNGVTISDAPVGKAPSQPSPPPFDPLDLLGPSVFKP